MNPHTSHAEAVGDTAAPYTGHRSELRLLDGRNHPPREQIEHQAARAIVRRYGRDSISPFVLRPDKVFHFCAGGMVAYRPIGRTAIVSGDPVGPEEAIAPLLVTFHKRMRRERRHIVVWAAGERYLEHYRRLGLRASRAGEEAFVDPRSFSLDGRRVRKLRQSVHRLERRGWSIYLYRSGELGAGLRLEVDAFEEAWKARQPRLLGFAMGFGPYAPDEREDDLYLMGRSPGGELRAVMRFIAHCGRLSLDTMHRVGDSPNGLNEALVCRALQAGREQGVHEISLNYAGLAHLVREKEQLGVISRKALDLLSRRFQMERLVSFNEKFSPEWRARYILYGSRLRVLEAVVRVLQVEGHLPRRRLPWL